MEDEERGIQNAKRTLWSGLPHRWSGLSNVLEATHGKTSGSNR